MRAFRCQIMPGGPGGPAAVQVIEAVDRAAAVRELIRRGLTPTSVEPLRASETLDVTLTRRERALGNVAEAVDPSGAVLAARFAVSAARSRGEMASFIRELATAIQAGLPLVQGLRTIARQGRTRRQREMLNSIIGQVEHGKSLGDAVAAFGRPFDDLTINLVRAGEASGKLGEVLMQAADLLDREVKLKRSVMAATLYPMILVFLVTAAIIVVVTVIVPRILSTVGNIGTLPIPTRIVQGVADFFGGYWFVIIPGVLITLWLLGRWYAQPGPRLALDRGLLRTPILGRLLRDVAVSRFTRTLGTLTAAGIPAVSALRVTKGTLGNKAMEQVIDEVCDQVSAGQTIADPMERSGYFPPMLVQIVNLGERSGRLDQMLNQAAGAFEEKTEMSVKMFTTALPPILVVMMACVVGFVVLAILLPLLQMQDAVGKL
jgi:type II secretory pathway component PulF